MFNLIVWFAIVALLIAMANVWLLRRVFRVNEIVDTLASIDRSLQMLPAVRDGRIRQAQRRAA